VKGVGGDVGHWRRWQDIGFRERWHLDQFYAKRSGHPPGYPGDYTRMWRIGYHEFWDEYGAPLNEPQGFTCYGDNYPSAQITYIFENYFTVEGLPMEGTQIVQLWGEYWGS
jgi:hypothetical protein